MITLSKKQMNSDPVFKKIFDTICEQHRPAAHTKNILMAHRPIKDYCEIAEHYLELTRKTTIYLSYTTNSWIKRNRVLVQIDSVTFYDDAVEFHRHRLRGIHTAKAANYPEQN